MSVLTYAGTKIHTKNCGFVTFRNPMAIMSLDAGTNVVKIASLCIYARFHAQEAEQDGDRNYGV